MIAAASLFAAVRVWRLGIVMTDNEVIVRGFTRTKRIPLADVERFDMSSPGVLRRDGMGRLWLRSGRHVWLWQIAPPHKAFFRNSRSAERVIEQLNDDLGRPAGQTGSVSGFGLAVAIVVIVLTLGFRFWLVSRDLWDD